MRKWWWYAEVYVGTGTKFGEIWMENGAVDGDVASRGRMSGLDGRMSGVPDVRGAGCPGYRSGCPGSGSVDEHRVERSNPGQTSEDFVDGNWGKDGKS